MAAKKNVSLAKLSRPHLHDVLGRERLFALLDNGLERGSVWISGPPGAGKTALAASYLEVRRLQSIWYQLDAGDDDLATFFHYLTQAVQTPIGRIALPKATPEHVIDVAGFARHYFRELYGGMKGPAVFVFDNYHELPGDSLLHHVLEHAALESPSNVSMILVSREVPPEQFARLQALDRLARIEWDELKLTLDEATAIASIRAELNVTTVHQLFALTKGWAAGLTLALERMKRVSADVLVTQSDAFDTVFNYFAAQILRTVEPDVREFLLRSSLVQHLTVDLARQLTGNAKAAQILEYFHRRCLFIDRRGEKPFIYQYHDLFRAFLQRQLEQVYTSLGIDELKQRTAHVLGERGEIGEAVMLFQQAKDWDGVARLVKAHAEQMIDQGRWQSLGAWFEGLPDQMVADDPELSLWLGMSCLARDPRMARGSLERAHVAFGNENHIEGLVRTTLALSDLVFIFGESLQHLKPFKATLEQITGDAVPLPFAVQQQAHKAYLDIAVVTGGRDKLIAATVTALEASPQSDKLSTNEQISINEELLLYSVFAADERLGGQANLILRRLEGRDDVTPTRHYFAIRNLGFWCYFRAEADYGVGDFARAIELADRWHMGLQSVVARVYLILGLCRAGRDTTAQGELAKLMDETTTIGTFRDGYVAWAQAAVAATRGDLTQAIVHTQTMIVAMQAVGFTLLEVVGWSLKAAYSLRLDHQNDALFAVQQARVLIRTSTWQRFDALLLSIEAEAASRVGDEVKAVTLIREMLPLTRNRIVAACLLELCDWVSRQLAQALKAGIEVEAARALIQAFELSPQTPLDEHWPWPVKIFLLGRFEILHNDAPIVATRKTPKKPLALLKALVCGGGSAVSIAQLIDWLWPDSEADAAKKAFEMALLRLRALLGGNHTLKLENGRLSLDRSTIWVDAWAFDALAQQTTNDANQLARAVQLYAGSLLPHDLDAAWALSYRERLRDSFKRLICNLATDLEATQRYAEALALYARGLEADDLVESMYQGAMRCHLNLGRRAEALATFQRLRRTLTAKLRTLPSTESVTLASAAET